MASYMSESRSKGCRRSRAGSIEEKEYNEDVDGNLRVTWSRIFRSEVFEGNQTFIDIFLIYLSELMI